MRYIIVGTGPSVGELTKKKLSLRDDVKIIAVNTAPSFLKEYDLWITVDPSPRNIRYASDAIKSGRDAVFVLGDNPVRLPSESVVMRRVVSSNPIPMKPQTPSEWFDRWQCVPGLSRTVGYLHTGNSVYVALGLAYLADAEKIVILGLDGDKSPSFIENHKPRNLSHLPILFSSAKPQLDELGIEVVVGSPESAVDCFTRMTPDQAIDWINS